MANYNPALDDVFRALSDPTRRAVLQRLVVGPASVGELAQPFAMALPSFMKHLGILERSGLVRSSKAGRVRTCRVAPRRLAMAEAWMTAQRAIWEERTDRLADFARHLDQET